MADLRFTVFDWPVFHPARNIRGPDRRRKVTLFRNLCVTLALLVMALEFQCGPSAAQPDESLGPDAQSSGETQPTGAADSEAPVTPTAPAGSGTSQTNAFQDHPFAGRSGGAVSAQELANQTNNPTAPLTLVQFRDIYVPRAKKQNGPLNSFQLQPVVPIGPFKWLPLVQLMKITMPLVNTNPGPGRETGMGDLTVFDLFTFKQSWGRWGFGPILVFPTATRKELGSGKYQAGPAVGIIYTGIKNLVAGAILQNPVSFAGSSSRQSVNQLIVSPTLTYNLPDGWFVGLTDYNWTFNWKDKGAATIPVGVQVGKVVRIDKQPISLSVEIGGAAVRPAGTPNPGVIIGFEITPIFNFHLGPGKKVDLRGKKEQ
jgi:hypothetical protein